MRIVGESGKTIVESQPFTLGGVDVITTREVSIKNLVFSPSRLVVDRGAKIALINNDTQPHVIMKSGEALTVIQPFSTYVIMTLSFASGIYEYRLTANPIAQLTIVIE